MPTADQIPTTVTNFTWSAFFGLVVAVINGTALGWWVKTRPNMRKLEVNADQQFRTDLLARVTKLEAELKETRTHYEERIDRLSAANDAAERIARHQLNNAKMRFRALVMLLKRLPNPPEGLTAILNDIEAMEHEQSLAEAAEKGAVAAAKITAAGKEC